MKRSTIPVVILAAMALFACAQDEEIATETAPVVDTSTTELPPPTMAQMTAAEFVDQAAADGMLEVRLGEIAQKQGRSNDVKQFGRMMVTDHSKANEQLAKIASDIQLMAPHALKPEHKAAVDRLHRRRRLAAAQRQPAAGGGAAGAIGPLVRRRHSRRDGHDRRHRGGDGFPQ